MQKTLQDLAQLVNAEVVGDSTVAITGVAPLAEAEPGDIAFIDEPRYLDAVSSTRASALIAPPKLAASLKGTKPMLVVDKPRIAFAKLVGAFHPDRHLPRGIHSTVVMEEGVNFGSNVSIGANAFIGRGAKIGKNTQIYPHVYVGIDTVVGEDCILYPHVTLYHNCSLGNRVIIHSGAVIGADGFGFEQVEGKHLKVPQVGTVIIEDDVEIGANTCIDRGALSATVIGEGTKIDNLVQIGHNCKVGKHCLIIALAGLAGSTVLEDYVMIAGQVGTNQHVRIGKGAQVGGQSGVLTDVPPGVAYSGYPAGPHRDNLRIQAIVQRLPELAKTIRRLEQEIERLKMTDH